MNETTKTELEAAKAYPEQRTPQIRNWEEVRPYCTLNLSNIYSLRRLKKQFLG